MEPPTKGAPTNYHEITLKGKNRGLIFEQLAANLVTASTCRSRHIGY